MENNDYFIFGLFSYTSFNNYFLQMNIDQNYLKFAVFDPTKCRLRLNLKVGLTRVLFAYPDRD